MRARWCAAGLLGAEEKFRRLRGHRQMPELIRALEREETGFRPERLNESRRAAPVNIIRFSTEMVTIPTENSVQTYFHKNKIDFHA